MDIPDLKSTTFNEKFIVRIYKPLSCLCNSVVNFRQFKKITIYLAFVQLVPTVQGLPLDFLSAVGSDPRPIYQICCGTN
jgi:hypothetical protein